MYKAFYLSLLNAVQALNRFFEKPGFSYFYVEKRTEMKNDNV